ncbi:uncharacterized protein VP01_4663g2 [Puccinia sorghi]|uniref:Retrotransposon gag domain-containing protein n=1 Tax=Puccinia sorghi TaxID=27349 RepID=A0A0L6UN78_9BASI|nr:uncharacterized protein VP01_4663g2 [Puccinia sorghi]
MHTSAPLYIPHNWPPRRISARNKHALMPQLANRTQTAPPPQPQQAPAPPTSSTPTSIVLAKPQPFNVTRSALAKSFVGQIGLHAITSEHFPNDSRKIFNGEELVFSEFIDDFKSSFFDHNCSHHAEVALQNLCQTGTVSTYTQDFNSHAPTVGWADAPLMSIYQHGPKENIQLSVVMSNIQFTSLQEMQAMALKAGQKIEGIRTSRPAPILSSNAPTTDPNAMELSAFQRGPHN